MKLKKLMALAMSGVLAVSMFAGCAEKTGDTTEGDNTGSVTTSPIVTAVNNAQDKIDFTSDNSLTNALKKVVAEVGAADITNADLIKKYVEKTTGYDYDDALNGSVRVDEKNGETKTIVGIVPVGSENAWTEDAVVVNVTNTIKAKVDALVDTTFVKYEGADVEINYPWVDVNDGNATQVGDKYNNYSYTGTVTDLVSVTSMDGTTNYYVAYTITQTTAVLTYEA